MRSQIVDELFELEAFSRRLISAYPFVDVANPMAYAAKIVGAVVASNLIAVGVYAWRGVRERIVLQP